MKRGFTLVELLAVIIILGLLALVIVPVVRNLMNSAEKSTTMISAETYVDGVEKALTQKALEDDRVPSGKYNIIEKGNLCLEYESDDTTCKKVLDVGVKENAPKDGYLIIEGLDVKDVYFNLDNWLISKDSDGKLFLSEPQKACFLAKDVDNNNMVNRGDLITCSTESFHVISNDGTTISMLAQYNLDVGNVVEEINSNCEWTCEEICYNQCYNRETVVTPIKNPTNIQDPRAKGYITMGLVGYDEGRRVVAYGVMAFSDDIYWYNNGVYTVDVNYEAEGRKYPYIYNEDSNIYSYIKKYEEYLQKENVRSAKVMLISYEQIKDLIDSDMPEWVYTTSYWTGSASSNYRFYLKRTLENVWVENYLEEYPTGDLTTDYYIDASKKVGIRPLVEISINELVS